MFLFVFLVAGWVLPGIAEPTCTSSAKLSMSRRFLPAAMIAGHPLGFGTCNDSNKTCQTPPTNCPDSSCCLTGIQSGSCGCAEDGLGPEWGDTACLDPKALRLSVSTCDEEGARHSTEVQLFAVPGFDSCQETATVEVSKEEGRLQVHVKFSVCPKLHKAEKDVLGNHRIHKRGAPIGHTPSGWSVGGDVQYGLIIENGEHHNK